MPRPVENDDYCRWQGCTDFDEEEDECALEECKFNLKILKWFEYMEALD